MKEISREQLKKLMGGTFSIDLPTSCEEECPTAGSNEGCPTGKTCKSVACGSTQVTLSCV